MERFKTAPKLDRKWDSIQLSTTRDVSGFSKTKVVCDSKRKENKREWKSTRYKFPSQWAMELKLGLEQSSNLEVPRFLGLFLFFFSANRACSQRPATAALGER
jgi:hypothetical protein